MKKSKKSRSDRTKEEFVLKCFVSSPFEKKVLDFISAVLNQKVRKIISDKTKSDVRYRHSYKLVYPRLDKSPFIAASIQQNVLESIKRCNVLIADITHRDARKSKKETAGPNANVMHEIGYATAIGVPVFLIGEEGVSNMLPANLKGSSVVEYAKISDLQYIEDKIKIEDKYDEFIEKLANTILNYIETTPALLPASEFIVQGFRRRRLVNLPYMLRNAKYRVYILTTNLEYIYDRLGDPIEYALRVNLGKFGAQPINKSFKVDILAMDPESIVTNARAKQLNVKVSVYRDSLRKSLREMKEMLNKYESNVEISTYITLPTLIMFVIDDAIVMSVPFPSQKSRLVPHFVSAKDNVTTEQFVSYFFSVKSQSVGQTLL